MALSPAFVSGLTNMLGETGVLTRAEDVIPYGFDGTASLKGRAGAVVFPRSTADVAKCVQLAAANPCRSSAEDPAPGLSGGSVPSDGCVVVCAWLRWIGSSTSIPRPDVARAAGRDHAVDR